VVWQNGTGIFERLDRLSKIITDFQLLDLGSPDHQAALDGRLNQNWLVGVGVRRHWGGLGELAYGGTLPYWALIPRAIWPDKPAVGGSGSIVSDFTGIEFAQGTAVGVGQVLEFYINFGVFGIVIGFFVLGFVLMRLDLGITRALAVGDTQGLLARALPGLCVLQPEGSLLEIVVSVVAALAVARLIPLVLGHASSRSRPVEVASRLDDQPLFLRR
jgi:hypothetical protein